MKLLLSVWRSETNRTEIIKTQFWSLRVLSLYRCKIYGLHCDDYDNYCLLEMGDYVVWYIISSTAEEPNASIFMIRSGSWSQTVPPNCRYSSTIYIHSVEALKILILKWGGKFCVEQFNSCWCFPLVRYFAMLSGNMFSFCVSFLLWITGFCCFWDNIMSNGRMTENDKLEMIWKWSQPGIYLEGEERPWKPQESRRPSQDWNLNASPEHAKFIGMSVLS
jgi:hypothetical protein